MSDFQMKGKQLVSQLTLTDIEIQFHTAYIRMYVHSFEITKLIALYMNQTYFEWHEFDINFIRSIFIATIHTYIMHNWPLQPFSQDY